MCCKEKQMAKKNKGKNKGKNKYKENKKKEPNKLALGKYTDNFECLKMEKKEL